MLLHTNDLDDFTYRQKLEIHTSANATEGSVKSARIQSLFLPLEECRDVLNLSLALELAIARVVDTGNTYFYFDEVSIARRWQLYDYENVRIGAELAGLKLVRPPSPYCNRYVYGDGEGAPKRVKLDNKFKSEFLEFVTP